MGENAKKGDNFFMTRQANLFYSEMEAAVGKITLVRTKKGLCRIDFESGDAYRLNLERWARRYFLSDQIKRDDQALAPIAQQLTEYFDGRRQTFDIELELVGTSFQKLVWNELLNIPYGETRSYKEVAQAIGAPKAVRAVGGANNRNHIPIVIPCHRVIGSNGALVGYGGGLHIKEHLLTIEGLDLSNRRKKA
jgi:methylated-DNA-[protein]-cysteine S-methyltransferase